MKKLFALALGLIICLSVTACTSVPQEASSRQKDSSNSLSEISSTVSDEVANDATVYATGDTATLGNWNITVTEYSIEEKIYMDGGVMYYYPDEEDNQYLVISASVTNNGKEADTFLPSIYNRNSTSVKVYYDEEYEYVSSSLYGINSCLRDSTMNPLTSKEGILAFSVPPAVFESEESLAIVFSLGKDSVTFTLR